MLTPTQNQRLEAIERQNRAVRQALVAALFTKYPNDWTPDEAAILMWCIVAETTLPRDLDMWFGKDAWKRLWDVGILQLDNGWLIVKRQSERVVSDDIGVLPSDRHTTSADEHEAENRLENMGKLRI